MQECEEMMQKEILESGKTSEYSGEVGATSCGTRVLADDVREGVISIEEAIRDVLTPSERMDAKKKCEKWLEERNKEKER